MGPDAANPISFAEHSEWESLHDSSEWRLLTNVEVEASEAIQRCHFGAFFSASHGTRHMLSPAHSIHRTLRIVRSCLDHWKTGRLWLYLHRELRMRILLKRRVREFSSARKQQRVETLESWLAYWKDSEAKAQEKLRAHAAKVVGGLTAGQAERVALAQVMNSTPEEVKRQVLWELYWLLLSQTATKKRAHWLRWEALLRRRRQLRQLPPALLDTDFIRGEPLTLRAAHAALFVTALQAPQFRYRAGQEVTFKQLVQLAVAPQRVTLDRAANPLRHASTVVVTFADSPLCSDVSWLYERSARPVPLIPPRTWRTEAPVELSFLMAGCVAARKNSARSDSPATALLQRRLMPLRRPSHEHALGAKLAQHCRSSLSVSSLLQTARRGSHPDPSSPSPFRAATMPLELDASLRISPSSKWQSCHSASPAGKLVGNPLPPIDAASRLPSPSSGATPMHHGESVAVRKFITLPAL